MSFPKNVILLNAYSFIPQFIISGMQTKESEDEVYQIKKSIRDAIFLLKNNDMMKNDTTVIFYGCCSLAKLENIDKVLADTKNNSNYKHDERTVFTNIAAINYTSQTVTFSLGKDKNQFEIQLEQFSDLTKQSVKLAHNLINKQGVERVILFGLKGEMEQLKLLDANTYNVVSTDKSVPMKDFTYLGLHFDFESAQNLNTVSVTVVVDNLIKFVLPILNKANSTVGKAFMKISNWF